MKQFDAAPGFIATAGEYSASTLVVTLPVQALTDSVNQALTSRAYVSAVMKQDVNFYVVFSDLTTNGSGTPAAKPNSNKLASAASGTNTTAKAQTLTMDSGKKSWYTASVSMRRADDFKKESMCDPLFFEKADIMYQGNTAELTLYVIDPVPKFAKEGTPIKDVSFLYKDKNYAATVQSNQKQEKHFAAASGFIESDGEYSVTPVKVVVPKQAIEDSLNGKLKCSAYINTVMKATQQFYVVLSDLEEGEAPADQAEEDTALASGAQNHKDGVKASAQQTVPEKIRLHTKLFPQILVYMLLTAVIVGGAFAAQWYRRR